MYLLLYIMISTKDLLGGKGGRCVGLTTLPRSSPDFQKSWKPQPPGALGAYLGQYRDSLTFMPA
jgi:hypothetical protein